MTENELELCVMRALEACGGTEECSGCPLNCEANDETCALYVIALARDPQGYEIRGGRAVPKEGRSQEGRREAPRKE